MEQKQYKVVFQPAGRTVFAMAGEKIIEAAATAGIVINTPCGGAGTCGKCRVKIVSPCSDPTDSDKEFFDSDQLAQGWRLGCSNSINCDCVIEVPETSRLVGGHKIQVTSENGSAIEVVPSLERFSPNCQNTENCFGIACDIGTTTMVTRLYQLATGTEFAVASRMNPQISFGDDVLSRIRHCDSSEAGLGQLQNALIDEINSMIVELCDTANISADDIYEISFAGNTTMEHLLCGVDPSSLGRMPFKPVFTKARILKVSELKILINKLAMIYVFPVIDGFVGGDTVAGILATDILNQPSPAIMIDIGTNGEIVLLNDGKLTAASAAAGPAFEGAGISCGMRAMAGAIEKIKFESDCIISVIGDCDPIGICGTALIDLAAEMLRAKILSPSGKILSPEELDSSVPDALKQRLVKGKNNQYDFNLAGGVAVTQEDFRKLQLALGAIRAGINIMLKKASLTPSDLKKVFIAGGFGSFIRRDNAQRIGLLPGDIDHAKISYVGNVSLAGAAMSLLSSVARKRGEQLAEQVEHVELSMDLDFQNEFVSAMIFP